MQEIEQNMVWLRDIALKMFEKKFLKCVNVNRTNVSPEGLGRFQTSNTEGGES